MCVFLNFPAFTSSLTIKHLASEHFSYHYPNAFTFLNVCMPYCKDCQLINIKTLASCTSLAPSFETFQLMNNISKQQATFKGKKTRPFPSISSVGSPTRKRFKICMVKKILPCVAYPFSSSKSSPSVPLFKIPELFLSLQLASTFTGGTKHNSMVR